MGSKASLKGKHKIFIADIAIRNAVLVVDDIPVSYTHLDVYKRQAMACFWRTRRTGEEEGE